MFSKQLKLEFFSIQPEITKLSPIIPAHEFKPKWWDKAQQEFVNATKDPNFGKSKFVHTAKCPGIFNLIRYGWIMTTWQDIIIKTNGDGETFEWTTPINQKTLKSTNDLGEPVGFQGKHQLSDFMGGWRNSLNTVIKLNTPWRCIVPKGYYLLEQQVPYADDDRFTTLPGFFSREYGVAQMNPQLRWHVTNGETIIKAGTPIAHYMLIPQQQADMTVMDATPEQIQAEEVTQLEINRTYVTDRSQSKCVFARMFGK